MNQQDWYLHEGPPAPPQQGVTVVGGSLGSGMVEICYSGSATVTIGAMFPGATTDDYVLVALWPAQNSSASVHWMSLDGNIQWLNHIPTSVDIGGAVELGPQIYWAHGFMRSANDAMVFRRVKANTSKEFCIKAWCLRGVEKMAGGSNYVYMTPTGSFPNATRFEVSSISWSVRAGCQLYATPPSSSGRGSIQVIHGTTSRPTTSLTDAKTFWWGATRYGPQELFAVSFTHSMGYVHFNEIVFDDITSAAYLELTETPYDQTAGGGFGTWTRIGNMCSATWQSQRYEGREIMGGSTPAGSGTGVHAYQHNFVPTVGQEYLAWVVTGSSTTATGDSLNIEIRDPNGNSRGVTLSRQSTNGMTLGVPFDGGFDSYLSSPPDVDGLPSTYVGFNGGTFTPSITGTHIFSLFAAPSPTNRDSTGGRHYGLIGGINPANKSIPMPHVNPTLDDRYGIHRAWMLPNTARSLLTTTANVGQYLYMGSFCIMPKTNGVPVMRLVPIGSPMWSPMSTYVRGDMVARWSPYNDEDIGGYLTPDRAVFHKRYEASDTNTMTFGHYYAEVAIGANTATTLWRMGMVAVPYGGKDGHVRTSTQKNEIVIGNTASTAAESWRSGQSTISYSQAYTIIAGDTVGIEILWDEGNYLKTRFYRDGSLIRSIRILPATTATIYMDHKIPQTIFIEPYATTMTVNVTGPFVSKPAGAVAYDYAREVP